jgi:cytochrome P450
MVAAAANLQPMFTKQRIARYAGHMARTHSPWSMAGATAPQLIWKPTPVSGMSTGQCNSASARRRDPRCSTRRSRPGRATCACVDRRRRSQTGQPLSDDDICHELVLFILAGHDTTSTTLAYSLWALGRHPEIQDRVFDEVSALGDRPLTPDDVSRLGHTVRVLHEALRLCPPAAGTPRMLREDLAVDGYRVEAGTMAGVSFYAMHRDPELWENPLTFDPDRFLPERSRGRNRWQYLPFGGGPRSCIGDHFAMLEATLSLATIVRAARIESLRGDFPWRHRLPWLPPRRSKPVFMGDQIQR